MARAICFRLYQRLYFTIILLTTFYTHVSMYTWEEEDCPENEFLLADMDDCFKCSDVCNPAQDVSYLCNKINCPNSFLKDSESTDNDIIEDHASGHEGCASCPSEYTESATPLSEEAIQTTRATPEPPAAGPVIGPNMTQPPQKESHLTNIFVVVILALAIILFVLFALYKKIYSNPRITSAQLQIENDRTGDIEMTKGILSAGIDRVRYSTARDDTKDISQNTETTFLQINHSDSAESDQDISSTDPEDASNVNSTHQCYHRPADTDYQGIDPISPSFNPLHNPSPLLAATNLTPVVQNRYRLQSNGQTLPHMSTQLQADIHNTTFSSNGAPIRQQSSLEFITECEVTEVKELH